MSNPWFDRRKNCPACSSDKFRTIYENKYDEGPVKVYLEEFYTPQGGVEFEYLKDARYILCECNVCDLIFQRDIPNDDLMKRLYDHWIDPVIVKENRNLKDLKFYSNIAIEIMRIVKHFGKKPSSLFFMDFGMGWGEWALMAKSFGCNSFGTELSTERKDYAKSIGINVLDWQEIQQYKFDFINTEQVFEHLSNPLEVLKHLKAALNTGGIIKISVPGSKDIKRRLKKMDWKSPKGSRNSFNAVAPLEHINCYRKQSILKMADEAEMQEVIIPKLNCVFNDDWKSTKKVAQYIKIVLYKYFTKGENIVLLSRKY
jgi:2-polyprenyl-3-methyl-5-hydroxy-6-metoxy-1,4-benzoquinol methylase